MNVLLIGNRVLYLTIEKRFNFSVAELTVAANGYRRFMSYLDVLPAIPCHQHCEGGSRRQQQQQQPPQVIDAESEAEKATGEGGKLKKDKGSEGEGKGSGKFRAQRLTTEQLPQRLPYERVKELEIWRIEPP